MENLLTNAIFHRVWSFIGQGCKKYATGIHKNSTGTGKTQKSYEIVELDTRPSDAGIKLMHLVESYFEGYETGYKQGKIDAWGDGPVGKIMRKGKW